MVTLSGLALHSGESTEVSLSAEPGPSVLVQRGAHAQLAELCVVRTDHGVTLATRDGRARVDLMEHLLAAMGGLGVAGGLRIEVTGAELPLLDGGCRDYAEALARLGLPCLRALRVVRPATLRHGDAQYRFEPGPRVQVGVRVSFPPPVGRQAASWNGETDDFRRRIAPARTFGWARDLRALRAAGRAGVVDSASVLVFGEHAPLPQCAPPKHAEPARHKLLDLIGDLAFYGGPPTGVVEAWLPGHTATHAILPRALAAGVLVRTDAR